MTEWRYISAQTETVAETFSGSTPLAEYGPAYRIISKDRRNVPWFFTMEDLCKLRAKAEGA